MTLEDLLRSAAQDVADRAPHTDVAVSGIESRARTVRRRQHIGLAAGVVAATAVAAVAVQAVTGGPKSAPEPMPSPTPTPTTSAGPGSPVITVPEIGPDDFREYEELGTVTNAQPEHLGSTELSFEVSVRNRFKYEWNSFCSGDPNTWFILVVGDGGAGGYGPCDGSVPEPFPTFPEDISAFDRSDDEPASQVVRMFVTGPVPQQHLDCFDRLSLSDCQDVTPPLEPLTSTDATFGVSVFEYWAPSVAEVAGQHVAALASVDGDDYVLSQVLTPGADQHRFATILPASDHDRLVTVVDAYTDVGKACGLAASSAEEEAQCDTVLGLRIGDRTVPLERGEFGDFRTLESPHGFFLVPAGADQEVEVRVATGNPDHLDFAMVVFEADS